MDELTYYVLIGMIAILGLFSGSVDEVAMVLIILYVLGILAGFVPVPFASTL